MRPLAECQAYPKYSTPQGGTELNGNVLPIRASRLKEDRGPSTNDRKVKEMKVLESGCAKRKGKKGAKPRECYTTDGSCREGRGRRREDLVLCSGVVSRISQLAVSSQRLLGWVMGYL